MECKKIKFLFVFLTISLFLISANQSFCAGIDKTNVKGAIDSGKGDDFNSVKAQLCAGSEGRTPTVKNFSDKWILSLAERGKPQVYKKSNSSNFEYIGMPIGGIAAGQVYLGGDGKLWFWDIFNNKRARDVKIVEAYQYPYKRSSSNDKARNYIEQGFAIQVTSESLTKMRTLDRDGFSNIEFSGQYPLGFVSYNDYNCPVSVKLEAFSPFIPLDLESSIYPATIFNYTITNNSKHTVSAKLVGWLENPVCIDSRTSTRGQLRNQIISTPKMKVILCDAATERSDAENEKIAFDKRPDIGSIALAILNENKKAGNTFSRTDSNLPVQIFSGDETNSANKPFEAGEQLIGSLGKEFVLKPAEKTDVTFILNWYFPNLYLEEFGEKLLGRSYGRRFSSALEVAENLGLNYKNLAEQTRLWHRTWYDSTLPHWFLDRTFLNTSILATNTCYIFGDGRFYGSEGNYCCPGTCTHVWGYVQAMGRLFPHLERKLREHVDFNPAISFDSQNGRICFRGEFDRNDAVDGQSGIVLRTYLAHQMSENDSFLRKNYDAVKKAMNFLIETYDSDKDGILVGGQHNTLDAKWYGRITWLSLYYGAALRAAGAMAVETGDREYARYVHDIADRGRTYIENKLFNGEYFIQEPDPNHPDSPGTFKGCDYDQLLGQSWAYQVGLGRILDGTKVTTALDHLWRYNFTADVGPYREKFKEGRWYAMPGEGGLIGCTWPYGGEEALQHGDRFFAGYLNECMNGFEYAAASLMMWHDMTFRALALTRSIHERYDGSKRNPFNEVECGSHYARSMASYGIFTAACGFEYNGPKGYIAFSPKLTPDNFRAAFTSAAGWGTFSQLRQKKSQAETIEVKWGKLNLQTLAFDLPEGKKAKEVTVKYNGKKYKAPFNMKDNRVVINLQKSLEIQSGQALKTEILFDN